MGCYRRMIASVARNRYSACDAAHRVTVVPGERGTSGQPRFQAFARIASGVSGCASGCALANSGSAIAVSKMRFTVG